MLEIAVGKEIELSRILPNELESLEAIISTLYTALQIPKTNVLNEITWLDQEIKDAQSEIHGHEFRNATINLTLQSALLHELLALIYEYMPQGDLQERYLNLRKESVCFLFLPEIYSPKTIGSLLRKDSNDNQPADTAYKKLVKKAAAEKVLDEKGTFGETALHLAASQGNTSKAACLRKAGADSTIVAKGKTPYGWALEHNHESRELLDLLAPLNRPAGPDRPAHRFSTLFLD